MSKSPQFTEAAWRKAWADAAKRTLSGWMTRKEIKAALGLTEGGSREFLAKLFDEGRLESMQELRDTYDGKPHPRTVYKVKDRA